MFPALDLKDLNMLKKTVSKGSLSVHYLNRSAKLRNTFFLVLVLFPHLVENVQARSNARTLLLSSMLYVTSKSEGRSSTYDYLKLSSIAVKSVI